MIETIQTALAELTAKYHDRRVNVFEVQVDAAEGDRLALRGRVLEKANLEELQSRLVGLPVDTSAVRVLRQPRPEILRVSTNLTSLYDSPDFDHNEQISQLLYGMEVEILDTQPGWAFTRQVDGYLGWAYRPYLTDKPLPPATHVVVAPAAELRGGANPRGELLSRVFGGTLVHLASTDESRAQIVASERGWVDLAALRAIKEMPQSNSARRPVMAVDATRLIGTPYLWGGCSVNGIDCSGFAQLIHRMVGLNIPRDADMQYGAGHKVEYPYKPGTLFFFGEKGERQRITHVSISLGNWTCIHSSRSRNGVYIDDVQGVKHLRESFLGAATFLF